MNTILTRSTGKLLTGSSKPHIPTELAIVRIIRIFVRTTTSVYIFMPYKERKAGINSIFRKIGNSLFFIQLTKKLLIQRRLLAKMTSINGALKLKKVIDTLHIKIF